MINVGFVFFEASIDQGHETHSLDDIVTMHIFHHKLKISLHHCIFPRTILLKTPRAHFWKLPTFLPKRLMTPEGNIKARGHLKESVLQSVVIMEVRSENWGKAIIVI